MPILDVVMESPLYLWQRLILIQSFMSLITIRASIEYARNKAREEGLGEDRIKFEVASSTNFPPAEGGGTYDLIAFFDCLHDMEDPQGRTTHALETLKKPDGTVMIVEPFANDKLEDNLNPVGRLFYAASTMVSVPASLSQNGPALGAQAGEPGISKVVKNGGFKRFRRKFDIFSVQ